MFGELFDFLIFLIGAVLVAMLILWCVKRFFPDVYSPARYIVGALVLIALLVKLKPLIMAAMS
jgi:hypothetical protein